MISALDAVTAIGPSVFDVVVAGRPGSLVEDVFVAEPGDEAVGMRGDLVLGVGFTGPAGAVATGDAAALVVRCARSKSSGVVLRSEAAREDAVRAAAEAHGLLLAGLRAGVTWAHVVWMLRGVVDRAAAPASPDAGDAGVHNDLFVLADTAAAIADAPVTIEDSQSRVLAYSMGQGAADAARVSTIIGRRVPPELLAHFRARGVFRRLAGSSGPFMVPSGPDGTLPRLVVPVRAGQEWLGSIWVVVRQRPSDDVVDELGSAASVLALHLLRLRAQADVARRDAVDRVRRALRPEADDGGDGLDGDGSLALPPGPWRVVALSASPAASAGDDQQDLWTAACRRQSWSNPLLADVDGVVFAIVTDRGASPGSWRWLRGLVAGAHEADPAVRAGAGGPERRRAGLPRSRAQAAEVLQLIDRGMLRPPVQAFEGSWPALTLSRATAGLDLAAVGGPALALAEHDEANGTEFVATLRSWLEHYGAPKRAAEKLHVHPNTLRHRMRRIGEVVDVDLADSRGRLALQLQLESLLVEASRYGGG